MSVPGFLSVMSFYLSQIEKGGDVNICLYLLFALSCLSTYRKVKRGLILTYVVTWLSLCHVFLLIAGKKGGGFNLCLYPVFPLSCPSTSCKLQRGWIQRMSMPFFPVSCPSTYRKDLGLNVGIWAYGLLFLSAIQRSGKTDMRIEDSCQCNSLWM